MLKALGVSAGLQHRQVTGEVRALIGEWVFNRVANPRLGGQVHHATRAGLAHQLTEAGGLGDVQPNHGEVRVSRQAISPRGLQGRVIVVVEDIDPHHPLATGQQPFGYMHSNKAGRAGDDEGHDRPPEPRSN